MNQTLKRWTVAGATMIETWKQAVSERLWDVTETLVYGSLRQPGLHPNTTSGHLRFCVRIDLELEFLDATGDNSRL